MQIYFLLRQRLLCIADTWIEDARIDSRDDIFLITWKDVDRCESNRDIEIRKLVMSRGTFYRKAKLCTPHFPHAIDSRGRILRPPVKHKDNMLFGISMSPGTIRGPVKVMHDPYSKTIEPGDILVAVNTDPGWSPLFLSAGAILLEIGGELQHGALIAREYGKPCVVGIQDLTNRVHDGQVVEVDGVNGVVRLDIES